MGPIKEKVNKHKCTNSTWFDCIYFHSSHSISRWHFFAGVKRIPMCVYEEEREKEIEKGNKRERERATKIVHTNTQTLYFPFARHWIISNKKELWGNSKIHSIFAHFAAAWQWLCVCVCVCANEVQPNQVELLYVCAIRLQDVPCECVQIFCYLLSNVFMFVHSRRQMFIHNTKMVHLHWKQFETEATETATK